MVELIATILVVLIACIDKNMWCQILYGVTGPIIMGIGYPGIVVFQLIPMTDRFLVYSAFGSVYYRMYRLNAKRCNFVVRHR